MMYSLYRLTAPILDKIPDISHQPVRRQVSIGLAASLLFHVLLLVLALIVGLVLPGRTLLSFAPPKPKLQEIELIVIPPAPREEEAPRLMSLEEIEKPRPFIDSRGLASSEKAPDRPLFEADVNMIAASELPALGSVPLPSQEGRVDPEFQVFATHDMSLGKTPLPFPMDVRLDTPAAPPAQVPPPPAPAAEPEPVPAAPKEKTMPAPLPKVAEPPKSTPMPLKEVTKPSDQELALTTKAAATPAPVETKPEETPLPPATPPPVVRPKMRTTIPVAMLETPPTPRARKQPDGYQPQQQKTRIEGSISNRGKNAVDAVATPLARYKKAVYDAVGSRWYFYTNGKTDVIAPGSVRVSFSIDGEGRVVGVKSEGNTSNPSFADMCERAVRDAEIAPPPGDLVEPLLDGKLDFSITFTFHTF